ncbi:ADP-forming succinate--CoA ligase subunit beta [Chloroflexota bacterium]
MKLHEYQAKELLAAYGVETPRGIVVDSPDAVRNAADVLGGHVVVKAQVHAGGRGKAGGVVAVQDAAKAEDVARRLLGSRLVTAQSGAAGLPVDRLLIEESTAIERELYLAVLVDPSAHRPSFIASARGGVDIEELASSYPDEIARVVIDPVTGILAFQVRALARHLGLSGGLASSAAAAIRGCYKLLVDKDCSMVEMNPLIVTSDGRLVALDAKVTIDDNALYRQPEVAALRDDNQIDPLEREAAKLGVSYVKMSGSIGCLVNGAGLAMATMDLVKSMGREPANFLDVGGGADEATIAEALGLLLRDPDVRVAWINIFGGILRCDTVARALIRVHERLQPSIPFVVRMQGTNADEATVILNGGPMSIMLESDLSRAARLAVATAIH